MERTKTRSRTHLLAAALALLLVHPAAARAQLFGSYTTGAVSSEGEGGIFMSAGNERFRTGAFTRFRITGRSDIGFQAGIDRRCDVTGYGGGVDLKFYIINGRNPDFPVDISIDGMFGHLRGSGIVRTLVGGGMIVSAVPKTDWSVVFEPYVGFSIVGTYYSEKPGCAPGTRSPCWLCERDDVDSETENILRVGVRFELSRTVSLMTEAEFDDVKYIGLALDVIF